MSVLIHARAALRSRYRQAASDDAGYMMIYVLLVIAIITALVGGTIVVTSSNIIPSVSNAYNQAAVQAAQAGLNQFVAYINANCAGLNNSTVATCTLPSNVSDPSLHPTAISPSSPANAYSGSGYSATYFWQAQKDPSNRYFRVASTGTVSQGGIKANKTLVADVNSGAAQSPLNYGVVVGFETESPSDVLANWPARQISFTTTGPVVDPAMFPLKSNGKNGGTVTWGGANPGTAAGHVAVCNATINEKGGRATTPPPSAPNPYVDWTEQTTTGNHYSNYQPCQTSWGHLTELLAPANPNDSPGGYYSADAMLISNSFPGGTGPLFNQPATTGYSYDPATDANVCGTMPGQNYRSFSLLCAGYTVDVGGSPSPSSTYPLVNPGPAPVTYKTVSIPASACVYTGPTRVKLNGDGTATVTSPQTTAALAGHPAQCYTGATAGIGMAAQTVNLTSPQQISVISVSNHGNPPPITPAIAHGRSGWDVTGQYHGATASTADSVFYLTNGTAGSSSATTYTGTAADAPYTPATADNPSQHTDGAWTPQWTSFTTGTTCSTSTAVTDLKFFNCYQSPVSGYSATQYSTMKATVQAALASAPQNYNTAATLQTYLTNLLAAGNSSDANNSAPTNADNRSHRWRVTVTQDAATTDGCTPASNVAGTPSSTPISTPSTDPFFQNVAGSIVASPSTSTTCLTATITLQVGTCNVALVGGLCLNIGNYVWGNGTALLGGGQSVNQFKVTTTNKTTVTTTTTTPAVSSFPYMDDVTQYEIGSGGASPASSDGPGDLYVEGTNPTTLALHAANDVFVTGTLTPTGGLVDAQTPVQNPTAALEVVGQDDIIVYHPVSCLQKNAKDTDGVLLTDPSNTTPGFCPDDATGLYSGTLASGNRPDQQYVNMRPDLANLTINGAVFALGNATQSITCPEPPTNNDGVCGGEFTVQNFNRGAPLGYVTVIGTLQMAHHAAVGQEWEIPDTIGQSSRPYSGYQFADRHQDLANLLYANNGAGNVLPPGPSTPAPWHILSTSLGTQQ